MRLHLLIISGVIAVEMLFALLSNVEGYGVQSQPVMSPLKMFEDGYSVKDIRCNMELILVLKTEDGSPACVKPGTANILM